jgi:hypothetical protein
MIREHVCSLVLGLGLIVQACGGELEEYPGDAERESFAVAAFTVPGRVQAEDYRAGGEGIGYHDTTVANIGGAYRAQRVDIQATTDAGGGYNVGWIEKGEWLAYSLTVSTAGIYAIKVRVASAAAGTKSLHLEIDGTPLPAATFDSAVGWQSFFDLPAGARALEAGPHTLKVHADTGKLNLNWIELQPSCAPRFAGDPSCAGQMYYGASVEGGAPATMEAQLGRGLSLFRSYMRADTPASKFSSRAADDIAHGRLPLISTKVPGSWAQVAAGAHDAWLLERIAALAAVTGPVWLTLHHEPTGDGEPADWVRMQQHARKLIDGHSKNIVLVGILNGWDFKKKNGEPAVWNHPVGTGVHVMGFDSYNPWSPTNGKEWSAAADVLSPGVTIASWGYSTLVGEHGCRTDPQSPGRAAQWMRDAYAFGVAHKFLAMSYFNSGENSPDGTWVMDHERLTVFNSSLARPETAWLP